MTEPALREEDPRTARLYSTFRVWSTTTVAGPGRGLPNSTLLERGETKARSRCSMDFPPPPGRRFRNTSTRGACSRIGQQPRATARGRCTLTGAAILRDMQAAGLRSPSARHGHVDADDRVSNPRNTATGRSPAIPGPQAKIDNPAARAGRPGAGGRLTGRAQGRWSLRAELGSFDLGFFDIVRLRPSHRGFGPGLGLPATRRANRVARQPDDRGRR